jgi:Polysaccharide lyase
MPRRIAALAVVVVAASSGILAEIGCGGGDEGVLLRTDYESSENGRYTAGSDASLQGVAPDRLQVVSSPRAQGEHALRVEVRQGDDPINSSGDRAEISYDPNESEGDERWYSWYTRFDRSYPYDTSNGWQIFTQFHSTRSGPTQPPVQFYASGNDIGLKTSPAGGDGRARRSITFWQGPMLRGRWRHFVLHARWSANPRRGFLELWVDGKRVLRRTPAQTLIPGSSNYLKQGLYRSDQIRPTAVLYFDELTVTDAAHPPPLSG